MSIKRLAKLISDKTLIGDFTSNYSFKNSKIIDRNEELLEILNIDSIAKLLPNGEEEKNKPLNIKPNTLLIPYNYSDCPEYDYFICNIDDEYSINIIDIISENNANIWNYIYYDPNLKLDLQSIMLYEKIKRERNVINVKK